VTEDVEGFLRWFFIARLGIIGVSTLFVVGALALLPAL